MLVNSYVLMLGLFLLPISIASAQSIPLQKTDVEKPAAKKFYSLDAARAKSEKQNGVLIVKQQKPLPLRSDKDMLGKQGGLRIDRAQAKPIPLQHSLGAEAETTPAPAVAVNPSLAEVNPVDAIPGAESIDSLGETESEEIEGNNESIDPVLALFGGSGGAVPSSFADAMRGGSSANIAGVMRHLGWPIPLDASQYVSSGYGMRSDPFNGRPTFHGGIDIATDAGTPVLATADGVVVQVKQDANYGKYVTLQHADGTLSRYGHLSAQAVSEGQRVSMGATIGAVGSTGRATGSHLDYRVSRNGMKFDPLAVLTIPSGIDYKVARIATTGKSTVAMRTGTKVMHPVRSSPMVIKVR